MIFRLWLVWLLIVQLGCTHSEPEANPPPHSSSVEPSPGESEASADLDLLRGTWEIVKAERDGAANPGEIGGLVTFDGDRAVFRAPDGEISEYKVVLHEQQQPKAIDWIMKQGNETHVLQGLYQLNGDTLINCSPKAFDSPRPTTLETNRGDGRFRFVLKRRTNFNPQ